MSKQKLNISVVMLCTDSIYIEISIQTILHQLHDGDELIVVIDNSPPKILQKIQSISSPQFSYVFSKKNGNRSSNRNVGFDNSSNNFIIFVDGDILLSEDCIEIFRNAWTQDPTACICGNVQGMQYEYGQICFQYRDLDIENNYTTDEGRKKLLRDQRLTDFRYKLTEMNAKNGLTWLYWYSAYCGTPSDAFLKAGKFDETLIGWGAEDVDLAYRLSKVSTIIYLKDLFALHLPHKRDIFTCRHSNMLNIFRLFVKYRNFDFACHAVFHLSHTSIPCMRKIVQIVAEKNCNPPLNHSLADGELLVLGASFINPFGKIIYTIGDKTENYDLVGYAVPVYDKTFRTAYISSDIFAYPHQVYSRILDEAFRVSEKVYILICGSIPTVDWSNYDLDLWSLTAEKYNYYTSHSIEDFSFIRISEKLFEVKYQAKNTQIPLFAYTIFDDMENLNCAELTTAKEIFSNTKECVFVNLSHLSLIDCPISSIARLLGSDIVLKYEFQLHEATFSLYTFLHESLQEYNFNFIFFVDSIKCVTDIDLWAKKRGEHRDVMIDIYGNIKILSSK